MSDQSYVNQEDETPVETSEVIDDETSDIEEHNVPKEIHTN